MACWPRSREESRPGTFLPWPSMGAPRRRAAVATMDADRGPARAARIGCQQTSEIAEASDVAVSRAAVTAAGRQPARFCSRWSMRSTAPLATIIRAPSMPRASWRSARSSRARRLRPDFTGIPDANPRGFALKFTLPDGSSADVVTHSFNGFPTATAEEFRKLLLAIPVSGPGAAKPTALDTFLGAHPIAKYRSLTHPEATARELRDAELLRRQRLRISRRERAHGLRALPRAWPRAARLLSRPRNWPARARTICRSSSIGTAQVAESGDVYR